METNSTITSRTDLQETQFTPPSVLQSVYNDEAERAVSHASDNEPSGAITPVGDSIRLTHAIDPDDPLKPQSLASTAPTTATRVLAPDLLRGLIMVLQAIDHAAVTSSAWSHGQAIIGEEASKRVTRWNEPVGYIARLATHLCAPGFMFLLGMGVVYFGRSRAKLGWSSLQMTRHFFVRAMVLFLVNWAISLMVFGKPLPILNIALLALAVNYFLSGVVWLAMRWTEEQLTTIIFRVQPTRPNMHPEAQPLLHSDTENESMLTTKQRTAASISFHIHNAILLLLAIITIWWNIWLDPSHGHCLDNPPDQVPSNALFEFLFHPVQTKYIFSALPPLATLSPALLGLLYARIVLSRPWPRLTINLTNLGTGLTLLTLFILTRLLHFGNLDEDCMAMPEHVANPTGNQYLVSAASFFYITKYPPSPSYLFFSMGMNFLWLGAFGFVPAKFAPYFPFKVLIVYGTCALFFYTVHLPLYSALGAIAKELFGHKMDFDDMGRPGRPAWGIGSGIVFWSDWLLGLLILYPACKAYGRFKATKGADSIWRFF